MRASGNIKVNRQELRREQRLNSQGRCPVCGKTSNRHNKPVHDRLVDGDLAR